MENNSVTNPGGRPIGSVVFVVMAGNRELYRSKLMLAGQEAEKIEVDVGGARRDRPGGHRRRQRDAVRLGGLGGRGNHDRRAERQSPSRRSRRERSPSAPRDIPSPSSTTASRATRVLETWKSTRTIPAKQADGREISTIAGWSREAGLAVTWEVTRFPEDDAADWVLYFENTGNSRHGDHRERAGPRPERRNAAAGRRSYLLHKTHGGTSDPMQFEPRVLPVDAQASADAGCGPRPLVGQGPAVLQDRDRARVDHRRGGLVGLLEGAARVPGRQAPAHDRRPGARPISCCIPARRSARRACSCCTGEGDTLESNAQFRQLIYKHYAAKRDGKTPLPILFCNTCFTRGGGWLNECNAENQISLIKAYAPLGLEALLTDAGWFTGGWPAGAGNWDPRKDAYPQGHGAGGCGGQGARHDLRPVVRAGARRGRHHGAQEASRVVPGRASPRPQGTYLLNFGLPEVQDYFFNIVKGFMDLPGFRFYRQDFNMDPLPYWRFNDAPDRQGITEMKYIEGLYAYWDRIAETWPDSLREECASGGHRIDLETVKRMHIAQKTDYWFDNDVDQAALWGLSQYLPNNSIVAHLNQLDDYSFHSTMASSLCLGWIADAPDFDAARGKKLLDRYLEVRHLLVGAWYPLLPYSRDRATWMAVQYHRPDLDEGMVLAFRQAREPLRSRCRSRCTAWNPGRPTSCRMTRPARRPASAARN